MAKFSLIMIIALMAVQLVVFYGASWLSLWLSEKLCGLFTDKSTGKTFCDQWWWLGWLISIVLFAIILWPWTWFILRLFKKESLLEGMV